MINPVILGAVVVQSIISGSSKIAGAIAGYAITTGIMLWGFSVYSEGNLITFFGIPLSQHAFVIACMVWYGFDTKEFIAAKELMAQGSSQQS
jgi:hypothetical protein